MTKAKVIAAFAVALLSCALAPAQTVPNRGRTPDRPLPNSDAAKRQSATITG